MDTVTCNISIKLDEEEMEMYSDVFNRLTLNKKPREIIENLHSYDCMAHQYKVIMQAISHVLKEMSVVHFVVLSQNVERALILSVMERIK
jgi:hypothetical protein